MAEAHDFLFTRQHTQQGFFSMLRVLHAFNQFHRRFVGTAMQRATQRTDGTGDAGVHIAQRGSAHAGGEGRGVEFVLSVQNQGGLHDLSVQLGWLFAVQGPQELFGDGIGTGFYLDAFAVVAEVVPVVDHARKQRQHAVGGILLLVKAGFSFEVTQHGATGTHHVHRVRRRRNTLQHFFQCLRQCAQTFQFGFISVQLCLIRQFAFQNQVSHFFKLTVSRQIFYVVTTVGQTGTGFTHGRQSCFTGDLTTQTRTAQLFSCCHCSFLVVIG